MARMIEQLVGRVLAITAKASTPVEMASEGVKALFDVQF